MWRQLLGLHHCFGLVKHQWQDDNPDDDRKDDDPHPVTTKDAGQPNNKPRTVVNNVVVPNPSAMTSDRLVRTGRQKQGEPQNPRQAQDLFALFFQTLILSLLFLKQMCQRKRMDQIFLDFFHRKVGRGLTGDYQEINVLL